MEAAVCLETKTEVIPEVNAKFKIFLAESIIERTDSQSEEIASPISNIPFQPILSVDADNVNPSFIFLKGQFSVHKGSPQPVGIVIDLLVFVFLDGSLLNIVAIFVLPWSDHDLALCY